MRGAHSRPRASSMTSAFFLGAFVTAHFLMPRSSIHWIHSLSPFTMGRPLSTAQHLSDLEAHSNGGDNLGPQHAEKHTILGLECRPRACITCRLVAQQLLQSKLKHVLPYGLTTFLWGHAIIIYCRSLMTGEEEKDPHAYFLKRASFSSENLSRNAWSRSGHRNLDRRMLWPPEMCSSKNSLSMGAPSLKPCAVPRLMTCRRHRCFIEWGATSLTSHQGHAGNSVIAAPAPFASADGDQMLQVRMQAAATQTMT